MPITYKKPPLVELVAELRWGTGPQSAAPNNQSIVIALPSSKDEETYMQFGASMSAAGYGRFERVMPPGIPISYGQVAVRCRPSDSKKQAPLFQLGHGVFTANALPPYKSWDDFSPIVRTGIDNLFESFDAAARPRPEFNIAMIRYIDAFRDELTGGRDIRTFLRDVIGIDILLPDAIMSKATDPADIAPTLQVVVPTAVGRLEMTFSEGKHGNDRAIIMDTNVLIERAIGSSVDKAVAALSDGRLLIHELFLSLTSSISDLMEPI